MPISDPTASLTLDLSRAEQWVAHHVLLDTLGLADGRHAPEDEADDDAVAALETLESGSLEFTVSELTALQEACRTHAESTDATADRNLASAVSERIGSTFEQRGITVD